MAIGKNGRIIQPKSCNTGFFFFYALATRKPNSFIVIVCISTNVISFSDFFQRNSYVPTLLIAQWAL